MKKFTDGQNNWAIEITVGSIKRIMALTKINLSIPYEPDENGQTLADRLTRDTILQVDVIYALLEPQAKTIIKLSAEELNPPGRDPLSEIEIAELRVAKFCELFKPEVMKDAEAALLEEWSDFFRKLARPATADVIEEVRSMSLQMQVEGQHQLKRLKGTQVKAMQRLLSSQVDEAIRLAESETNGEPSESATASPVDSELETSTA